MSKKAKLTTKAKNNNQILPVRKVEGSPSFNSPYVQILDLQRTIGNKAVERMFRAGVLQAKLRIGRPNDIYEREADRVAEQVVSMPDAGVGGRSATHGRSAGGQGNDIIRTKPG